ncbi:MAG: asparagine synthase (glutamine-hydrolyzing) [Nitrospiraceae bacterium]
MCGIAGILNLSCEKIPDLSRRLGAMNALQRHRGPDGEGLWEHPRGIVGFGHRRLSIIDLATGQQPMRDQAGNWVTYNGEIYNYLELREELGLELFTTRSDTEVILHAYRKWGHDSVNHFRGMFAFALWDEARQTLFCARDRFGIKPIYYTVVEGVLYLASEIKALLPFVPEVETNLEAFKEYLTFQLCLAGKTLFKGIRELLPGHVLIVRNGDIEVRRYWEVYYTLDFNHTSRYFEEMIRSLLEESVAFHLRSDVPVGAYVSGGLDSSIIASLAIEHQDPGFLGFNGKFSLGDTYDESRYARDLAGLWKFELLEKDITATDFVEHIQRVIYHLDFPVAGPGSFPQYMVAHLASRHRKVVLGGQGGDEIFGGYARYLIAYFEQCIKAAIDGTMQNGKFVVTYESIIPNLVALRQYKPLLQEFWRKGLFDDLDKRYFRLINRARDLGDEINWAAIDKYSPYDEFCRVFRSKNVSKESYFDCMTHFDFKTLLPALLHVEDRMSMAHGLESRVPFLDHPLIELAATIPSDVKFKNGRMKHVLKNAMRSVLPESILNRTDKMGFPVPLQEWLLQPGVVQEFVRDVLSTRHALSRDLVDNRKVLNGLANEPRFGRRMWGLLCLELWQQTFHDRASSFKQLLGAEALQ